MKAIAVLLASLLVFGVIADESGDAKTLSDLVDEALREKSKELRNIELPDKEVLFNIPFTAGQAGAQLRDGIILGLEDLHRSEEPVVRQLDDHVEISVHVAVTDVRVYWKANMYFKKPMYNVHVNGALNKMVVNVGLKKEGDELKVKFVRVTEFDGFELKIDAPGFIVDTFVNTALRATRFAYEPLIKAAIESRVRTVVEEEVKQRNSQ